VVALVAAICLIVLASVVFVVVLLRVSDQKAVDAKGLILAFIALLGLGVSAVTAVYLATHGDRYMSEIKGEFWVNVYGHGAGAHTAPSRGDALKAAENSLGSPGGQNLARPLGQIQVSYLVRKEGYQSVTSTWHPTNPVGMPHQLRAEPVGESSAPTAIGTAAESPAGFLRVPEAKFPVDAIYAALDANAHGPDAKAALTGVLVEAGMWLVWNPPHPSADSGGPPVPSIGPTVRFVPVSGPPVSNYGPPVHANQIPTGKFYSAVINSIGHREGAERLLTELAAEGMALVWSREPRPTGEPKPPSVGKFYSERLVASEVETKPPTQWDGRMRQWEARGRREALCELARPLIKMLSGQDGRPGYSQEPVFEYTLEGTDLTLVRRVLADYLGDAA
jgi:hypothetical protein